MTEAQELTLARIEEAVAAGPLAGKAQTMLWDKRSVGLGLKIRASGTHSWVFCFRPKGVGRREQSRTITIGTWPRVTLDAARTKATALAGEVAQWKDPAADLRGERTREKRVVSAAIEGYVASIRRRKLVAADAIESGLKRDLASVAAREIDKLERSVFVAIIEALENAGRPGSAANLRKYCHSLLEWCLSQGIIRHNVLAGLRRPRSSRAERLENQRTGRALSDDEIRALWSAAGHLGPFGGLVRLGRRVRSEFDSYADSVSLKEFEAGAVVGFSGHTLKFWRLSGSAKGPRPIYIFGMVHYTAGEIRRWRGENSGAAGCVTPMGLIAEPQKSKKARASTGAQRPDGLGLAPVKSRSDAMKARPGRLRRCAPWRGRYPALSFAGEQGTAKSTVSKILRALIDPNTAPLRALPRNDRELFIAATNAHLLVFDNVSGLSPWLSDTLCRLSSGGGFSVRSLWTNNDEVLFDAARPTILNGIGDIITRPDLADRALFVTLEQIPDTKRRSDSELSAEFEAKRPRILGALADALAVGLRLLPTIYLPELPRMADFAMWATACEQAFWQKGTFQAAYSANLEEVVDTVIEADLAHPNRATETVPLISGNRTR